MKALLSFETPGNTHKTTEHHIPEDLNPEYGCAIRLLSSKKQHLIIWESGTNFAKKISYSWIRAS